MDFIFLLFICVIISERFVMKRILGESEFWLEKVYCKYPNRYICFVFFCMQLMICDSLIAILNFDVSYVILLISTLCIVVLFILFTKRNKYLSLINIMLPILYYTISLIIIKLLVFYAAETISYSAANIILRIQIVILCLVSVICILKIFTMTIRSQNWASNIFLNLIFITTCISTVAVTPLTLYHIYNTNVQIAKLESANVTYEIINVPNSKIGERWMQDELSIKKVYPITFDEANIHIPETKYSIDYLIIRNYENYRIDKINIVSKFSSYTMPMSPFDILMNIKRSELIGDSTIEFEKMNNETYNIQKLKTDIMHKSWYVLYLAHAVNGDYDTFYDIENEMQSLYIEMDNSIELFHLNEDIYYNFECSLEEYETIAIPLTVANSCMKVYLEPIDSYIVYPTNYYRVTNIDD